MRPLGLPLLLTVAIAIGACGGNSDEDAAAPAAGTAAAAATPLPDIDFSNLQPGATYVTKQFQPSITFTVPAKGEYKLAGSDSPDHVEIEPVVEDPVDSSALAFHHMTQVFPPDEGGVEPGDAVPGPDDFVKWLTEHPHLETTKPEPVEALGLKGMSVDIRVKSSQPRQYKDCGKVEGDCVVLFVGKIEAYVYGSTGFGRFYVLEQPDGKELVVEQFVEPAKAFEAQQPAFEEILGSATASAG